MFNATLKSLAAHKLRLALTAIAIILGVAFVAGTFVLTDTVKHTFDQLFAQTTVGKDLIVQATSPYGNGGGFDRRRPTVPASLVDVVKSTPGVRDAVGQVSTTAGAVSLVGPDGKLVNHRAPIVVTGWTSDRALSSFTLVSGQPPTTAHDVLVDLGTADNQHYKLGDQLTVIGDKGPEKFTLVGLLKFGSSNSLAGATLLSFDTPVAQEVVGSTGRFAQIAVADKSGVDTEAELNAIAARLPKGYEVQTAAAVAASDAKTFEQFLTYFKTFLLVFAGIALFVGAFLIANTFSILIGQRTRELALLRALGARRSQVVGSLLGESLVTGVVGSAIGLLLGIPLAAGLYALLKAGGLGIPASHLQVLPRTIWASLLVGTVVTVTSAVGPAARGSRVPPVAAMRDDVIVLEASLRRRAIVGGIALALGVLLLASGLFGSGGIAAVGLGAALTFLGVAVLAPFVTGQLARWIGSPLPRMTGVTGRLGRENAARNPRRTAATASALMVGLGLVTALATLGASLTASFTQVFKTSLRADYIVSGSNGEFGFISPAAGGALAKAPGVLAVSPYMETDFHQGAADHRVAGIDPAAGPQVLGITMVSGSESALGQGEMLVDSSTAKSSHLVVGDVIPMGFDQTGVKPVKVGGTYKTNQFLDHYVVSYKMILANTVGFGYEALFVKTATRDVTEQNALRSAVREYPNLKVQTGAEFNKSQAAKFATFLRIADVMLALSIIIAAFSVINTMALSVIERTKEIGLVRAIGMMRRQVRAAIRSEAVIVALIGAVMGIVLGVALGSAIVAAIGQGDIPAHYVIPVPTVLIVLILAALIGVVAAVFPARRAARVDILQAIAVA